jgi:magnesium-transporting ATPase (P-type)
MIKNQENDSTRQLELIPWHTKKVDDLISSWSTCLDTGLSTEEAAKRVQMYGFNELSSDSTPQWIKVLLRQLLDVMNWIFFALGIAAIALDDYITGPMLVVLALGNLLLSFSQEYAAEQTLAALNSLSSPTATVIRDGQEQCIPSRELVLGDLLLIKEGDSIPADARLFCISNLEVDEALLTGESVSISKQLIVLENEGKIFFF